MENTSLIEYALGNPMCRNVRDAEAVGEAKSLFTWFLIQLIIFKIESGHAFDPEMFCLQSIFSGKILFYLWEGIFRA